MNNVTELLEQYGEALRAMVSTEPSDESWESLGLRERAVELLERGHGALASANDAGAANWNAMKWDANDPPVLLTRAVSTLHQRLAAAHR